MVVWNGPGSPGFDIYGQRYDASGQPVSGEFVVNTDTSGNEYRPDVAALPGGGFIVCWSGHTVQGPHINRIVARRFGAGGAFGPEIEVAPATSEGANFPAVAAAPDGTFVIVWKRTANVVGRRFDASGNLLGAEFQVNQLSGGIRYAFPRVAMAADGRFVVAWVHAVSVNDSDVHARRFSAAAVPEGPEFTVNVSMSGPQGGPSIVADRWGDFVVAWSSLPAGGDYDVFARRFDRSGAPRGGEFRVNSFTTAAQAGADMAGDGVGNFVVAWSGAGPGGDGEDVFAQRFGGLVPAAVAVDTAATSQSDGNRVLEPGESVDLRPSWRNVNGATQTFDAALSGFTGPAGASYTITDGNGTYGSVPDGATAACSGCYGLGVSAPPSRPALHWDASAVESISPEALGQRQLWSLHVGESFTDVLRTSPFYLVVETLLHHGVTSGCSSTGYCPQASTLREQMPVFLLLALEGRGYRPPACGTPLFADVPASSPFCSFIEEMVRRGTVAGCGGANYCPSAPVTREEMAVFVLRTVDPVADPPACTTPLFADVPASSPFCRWIEELARRGVVAGCGGGNYCPTAPVAREEMAVFIADGLGLKLYGP